MEMTEQKNKEINLEPGRNFSTSIASKLIDSDEEFPDNETTPRKLEQKAENPEDILKKLEKIDRYQIPPSLSLALKHYKCSKISQPLKPEDLENGSKFEVCPCCCQMMTRPYSIWTDGANVSNYGSVIPLYFTFTKYAVLVLLIFFLGNSYNLYTTGMITCEIRSGRDKQNPGRCEGNIKLSDFYNSHQNFYSEEYTNNDEEVVDQIKTIKWTRYACFTITYFTLMLIWAFFYMVQKEFKRNFNSDEISASDFTIMVGNVHETADEASIRDFIYEKIREKNMPPVKIAKINIATYRGNLERLDLEINEQKSVMNMILEHLDDKKLKKADKEALLKKKKEAKKKKLSLQSKKWQYKRRIKKFTSAQYNSVAFVTMETKEQKKIVLKCKSKKRLCICRLSSKSKKMQILKSIEPDDVKWKFIGFSTWKRAKTKIVSGLTIFLLLICFYFVFIILGILKSSSEFKKDELDKQEDERFFLTKILFFIITSLLGIITNIFAIFLEKLMNLLMRYEKYMSIQKYIMSEISLLSKSKLVCVFVSLVSSIFLPNGINPKKEAGKSNFSLGFKSKYSFDNITELGENVMKYFIANVYIIPILSLLDFSFIKQLWKRRNVIKEISNSKDQYIPMTQGDLLDLYERPESKITVKYSNIILTLYLTAFFADPFPAITIPALLFVLIQSNIDKILFFTRYKPPMRAGDRIAIEVASNCRVLPKLYFGGKYFFLVLFNTGYFITLNPTIFIVDFVLFLGVPFLFEWLFDYWLMKRKRRITHLEAEESIIKVKQDNKVHEKNMKKREKMKERKLRKTLNFRNITETFSLDENEDILSIPYSRIEPYIVLDYDRENPMTKERARELWLFKKSRLQRQNKGMIMTSSRALFRSQASFKNIEKAYDKIGSYDKEGSVRSRNLTFLMKHIEAVKEESKRESTVQSKFVESDEEDFDDQDL